MNRKFNSMKKYKIGLLGLGVVGTALVKKIINSSLSQSIVIEKILVTTKNKSRSLSIPDDVLTTNFNDIIDNPTIDIIIELIGGDEPAYTYLTKALDKHIPVITANKSVMANYGSQLIKLAIKNNTPILFEASVGGGIPVIRNLINRLDDCNITNIYGIANGTSNYIVSKISKEHIEFDQALKQAQDAGYAEFDPSQDVDGIDAMYKSVILASLCFKDLDLLSQYNLNPDIYSAGIRAVTSFDLEQAKSFNYILKPIIFIENIDNNLYIGSFVALIPKENSIAQTNDVNNIFQIKTQLNNYLEYVGPGAGGDATADSVISDLKNLIKDNNIDLNYYKNFSNKVMINNINNRLFQFYLNMSMNESGDYDKEFSAVTKCAEVNNIKVLEYKYINNKLASKSSNIIMILDNCNFNKVKELTNALENTLNVKSITCLPILEFD